MRSDLVLLAGAALAVPIILRAAVSAVPKGEPVADAVPAAALLGALGAALYSVSTDPTGRSSSSARGAAVGVGLLGAFLVTAALPRATPALPPAA